MFTRAFATAVNSISGTVTPADAASIAAALSSVGSGNVTLGAQNASFRLTGFTTAPAYDPANITAAPIIFLVLNFGTASNNNTISITAYSASGATLATKNFVNPGAGGTRTVGFPLGTGDATTSSPNISLQIRAAQWFTPMTIDAVYIDYYSADAVVSLTGTWGPNNGWVQNGTEVEWSSSMWAQTGFNNAPKTYASFPAAGIVDNAILVGSSFTVDQRFWAQLTSGGIYQYPTLSVARWPLTAPWDTSTPMMTTSPLDFAASQGYTSDSVQSSASGNYVYMNPNPMEYGYEGCLWTEGTASAGGYIPTLANFNAAQVAMAFSTRHQWTVQPPFQTSARTEARSPVLRVYYDLPQAGFFVEI